MSTAKDPEKRELSERRTAEGEHRLPPAIAVVVAGVTYALLPESLLFGPRYVIAGLEVLLLVALVVTNPRRMTRETRWSRLASIGLACLIIVTNMGVSVYMFTVGALPGFRDTMFGPAPVWNQTFYTLAAGELAVFAIAMLLPLLTVARRRDFI